MTIDEIAIKLRLRALILAFKIKREDIGRLRTEQFL